MTSPLIIAHRGSSFYAPENTLAAFKMAIEAGADGVEFDVQLAADGVPVVIHDPSLVRTGARPDQVADLTSEHLGTIDVGTWFNKKHPRRARPAFANETVPTLAAVLDQLSGFNGVIYIEIKATGSNVRDLTRAVCDVVRSSSLLPQVIIKSFKLAVIPEIRCQLPDVKTAALFAPEIMSFLRRRQHMIAIAHEFGANQISLHRSMVSKGFVNRAAETGLPVTVWTADTPKWFRKCQKLNVGALISNNPAKLVTWRSAHNK